MTGIKLLGVVCVLTAGGFAAVSTAREEKKKLAVLDAWIAFLWYLRAQIDCFLTPLDEILANTDRALLEKMGYCGGDRTLTHLAEASANGLDAESARLIRELTREAGNGYREDQVKRCDYFIGALTAIRKQEAESLPARVKMRASLCVCAALGTAILLW